MDEERHPTVEEAVNALGVVFRSLMFAGFQAGWSAERVHEVVTHVGQMISPEYKIAHLEALTKVNKEMDEMLFWDKRN